MNLVSAHTTPHAAYAVGEPRSPTREEWDGMLAGAPGGGHVLQSHEWGEFKRRLGWRPVRLVLQRDGETAGVGQFLVRPTLPVPGALMYCTKGPWLPWEDAEAVRAFFDGAAAVAGREGAHTVKIEPEVREKREDIAELLSDIGFRKARYDLNHKTTMVADLSPDEEDLLAKMKPKTRYNVRLAARKDVEVAEARDFDGEWEEYYGLALTTAARAGEPIRRPRSYVREMARRMRRAGRAHLFFAEHRGERLAAMLVFTFGRRYWYQAGASADEKRNLMPTYLLQWEVMRWAKSRGMTHYDMVGIPKPENLGEEDPMWGLYRFKSGFGGEIADFLGCLDLPVGPRRAAAWRESEPVYYRAYSKLTKNVFY